MRVEYAVCDKCSDQYIIKKSDNKGVEAYIRLESIEPNHHSDKKSNEQRTNFIFCSGECLLDYIKEKTDKEGQWKRDSSKSIRKAYSNTVLKEALDETIYGLKSDADVDPF
jgi:hypothetical protein